jgi:hypothetical protein
MAMQTLIDQASVLCRGDHARPLRCHDLSLRLLWHHQLLNLHKQIHYLVLSCPLLPSKGGVFGMEDDWIAPAGKETVCGAFENSVC